MASSRGSRYLEYETVAPARSGLLHVVSDLRCLLTEARSAGRLAILPQLLLRPRHNFGIDREWRWDAYFDFGRSVLADSAGEHPLPLANHEPAAELTTLVLDPGEPLPPDAADYPRIVRRFSNSSVPFRKQVPLPALARTQLRLAPSAEVTALAAPVLNRLAALSKGGFVAVHARRGDRVAYGEVPSRLTEPAGIRRHLRACEVADGSAIFLASDERRADFWKPLEEHYRLVRYVDFPKLAALVSPRDGLLPDNYLLYQVEREVMKAARLWIETLPFVEPCAHSWLVSERFWTKTARRRARRDRWRLWKNRVRRIAGALAPRRSVA